LAIGDRARFQHEPPLPGVRVEELIEQAGLADPGIAHDGDDLPPPPAGLLRRLADLRHLGVTPNAAGQAPRPRTLQARANRGRARELEDVDRLSDALDGNGPEGLDVHEAVR